MTRVGKVREGSEYDYKRATQRISGDRNVLSLPWMSQHQCQHPGCDVALQFCKVLHLG